MRHKNLPHRGDRVNGKISIFDQQWFEKLLPEEMEVVSHGKMHMLAKNDCTINGDLCQFNYWHPATGKDGDVTEDGEPCCLEFDIHFMKNEGGIKMIVDISYGDHMACEFSLEAPNRINVIHYNGIGSKYDSDLHWGLSDKSVSDLVRFFNSFEHGIRISEKDLAFIDEHEDSYEHDINDRDHYYTDDSKLMKWGNSMRESIKESIVLVMDNSKEPEKKYLPNVIGYLRKRGIAFEVASSAEELERIASEFEISGAISTGSDYMASKGENQELSDLAMSSLKCPILGICFGFQSMARFYGADIETGEEECGKMDLDRHDESFWMFSGKDLSGLYFCFHDYPKNIPAGFKSICEMDGKIVGIASDSLKRYGILFHPEEQEKTYPILDSFIERCLAKPKMRYLMTYESFSRR
jgi:GMP synthase-like glutamine amidotransferase